MLGILHAVKKWVPYLMGRHFNAKIYHDSMKYFMKKILYSGEK